LHRDHAARTQEETMPLGQEPKRLPMSADSADPFEEVGVADNSSAKKPCSEEALVVPDESDVARALSAALGSVASARTSASTTSLKREVLMPWEKPKWLAVGARPAMKGTSQGSLRQVAGLTRLKGASTCSSLSSARSLPTWSRDGAADENDAEPKMDWFPSSGGSASSLASPVALPQRLDQSERAPGLTRQRRSNALHRSAADCLSVTGGGGIATPSACRTRRRHSDGGLRDHGAAVASAPLLTH